MAKRTNWVEHTCKVPAEVAEPGKLHQRENITMKKPNTALAAAIFRLEEPCHHMLTLIEAMRQGAHVELEARDFRELETAVMDEAIRAGITAEPEDRARLGVRRWRRECFEADCRYPIEITDAWQRYERWAEANDLGTCVRKVSALAELSAAEEQERGLWLFEKLLAEEGRVQARYSEVRRGRFVWGIIRQPEPEPEPQPEELNATLHGVVVTDRRRFRDPARDADGRFRKLAAV